MKYDQAVQLAREAGLFIPQAGIPEDGALMRFANLVAEYERESCAKMCEEFPYDCLGCLDDCAAAIRSRSNT